MPQITYNVPENERKTILITGCTTTKGNLLFFKYYYILKLIYKLMVGGGHFFLYIDFRQKTNKKLAFLSEQKQKRAKKISALIMIQIQFFYK